MSARPNISPRPLQLVPALAAAQLRHEWILSLCLVVALAAVISPLLVLLGLKNGTIETLRERLVEDPVFRELRPAQTREYRADWFDEVRAWPGVAFLTPTILPLSSVLQVVPHDSSRAEIFDLLPTAPGDPLLLENGAVVPADGELVLTAEAARRAGVGAGDELEVRVTRSRAGRTETAGARLKVAAVLAPRAGSLARAYAPLAFVLDVEAYKEGYAAPARGWAGDTPEPYLSFDGAVLLLPTPLQPIVRTGLIINTGFARITEAGPKELEALLGFEPPRGFHGYTLESPGAPITISSLRAVEQKLRGYDRALLPYVRDLTLTSAAGEALRPIGLSLDTAQAALLGLEATPWGGFAGSTGEAGRLNSVLWPASVDAMVHRLAVESAGVNVVSFELVGVGSSPYSRPIVPVELLGVLRTATQRGVRFEAASGRFEMARGGYRGFRLYASSIDDVPALFQLLRGLGIETLAEVEAIERIQVLDAGLTRLFWLISLLSISGGTAVLVASLYASVERRRRDLGVLRLLGFARAHVFFFPVAQGAMLASLGLVAGFSGYAALAFAINRSFASELAPGEAFCTLPAGDIPLAIAATLALAVLASLVAAARATRIDPAEAIREQ